MYQYNILTNSYDNSANKVFDETIPELPSKLLLFDYHKNKYLQHTIEQYLMNFWFDFIF